MDQATINSYQAIDPSTGVMGTVYAGILAQHGQSAADACASAALSGSEQNINAVLALYEGTTTPTVAVPLADTSTADALATQLETNPLAAPLAGAETIASNSLLDFIKSPSVLLILGLAAFFFLFDGLNVLRGLFKKGTP